MEDYLKVTTIICWMGAVAAPALDGKYYGEVPGYGHPSTSSYGSSMYTRSANIGPAQVNPSSFAYNQNPQGRYSTFNGNFGRGYSESSRQPSGYHQQTRPPRQPQGQLGSVIGGQDAIDSETLRRMFGGVPSAPQASTPLSNTQPSRTSGYQYGRQSSYPTGVYSGLGSTVQTSSSPQYDHSQRQVPSAPLPYGGGGLGLLGSSGGDSGGYGNDAAESGGSSLGGGDALGWLFGGDQKEDVPDLTNFDSYPKGLVQAAESLTKAILEGIKENGKGTLGGTGNPSDLYRDLMNLCAKTLDGQTSTLYALKKADNSLIKVYWPLRYHIKEQVGGYLVQQNAISQFSLDALFDIYWEKIRTKLVLLKVK